MTLLAITADLHVDPAWSRIDPETGLNARLLDYLRTTTFVALEARKAGAKGLVVAGDFTERRHPAPWLVSRIREALAHGPERQVYVRGNHDGEIADGSIVTVLSDGEKRTAASRPSVHLVGTTAIAAIPYLDKHWIRTQPGFEAAPEADVFRVLGEQFVAIAAGLYATAKKKGARAIVLVCHQTLAGGQMSDSQQAFLGDVALVVDSRALAAIGFAAVVAGHLHRHQVVVPGDRPVLYAGSIERVDFGEQDETKGFVLLDVMDGGKVDWTFVETPARRWVTFDDATIGDAVTLARDAIVRARFTDPDVDVVDVRRYLEELGAFAVGEVVPGRRLGGDTPAGLSESLTPSESLVEYFSNDPDRDALLERGRELLAAVA